MARVPARPPSAQKHGCGTAWVVDGWILEIVAGGFPTAAAALLRAEQVSGLEIATGSWTLVMLDGAKVPVPERGVSCWDMGIEDGPADAPEERPAAVSAVLAGSEPMKVGTFSLRR